MDAAATDGLDKGLGEIVSNEVAKAKSDSKSDVGRSSTTEPLLQDMTSIESGKPIRRILGGFEGLSEDLERRARDSRNMVRVLQQERPLLEIAEAEYVTSVKQIAKIFPEVQETSRGLMAMIDKTKSGDVSEALGSQFSKHLKFIDELESSTQQLTENLLRLRSTWEQYARSIMRAQRMRDAAGTSSPAERDRA